MFFRTAVLRKLSDIRFSYKQCNFSRTCLLVKMASKTVTRSICLHGLKDWRCMVISDISVSDNGKSPPIQPKGKTDPFPRRKSKSLLHEILVTF